MVQELKTFRYDERKGMSKAFAAAALLLVMALSQVSMAVSGIAGQNFVKNKKESSICSEHVFASEETLRKPGLLSEGLLVRTCRKCGYSEKVVLPELMQACTYTYTNGTKTIALPYRIYYPSACENDAEACPVVLYYHGAGEVGTNNVWQVRGNALLERLVDLDNAILIAPQCREGYQWVNTPWSEGSYDSTRAKPSIYLDATIALLDEILHTGRADENRVYAVGVSMGGYAAWKVGMEYPERFSAIIPICGAADPARAAELLDVSIWAFHGETDRTVPVSGSWEMVEAIKALGGTKVKYTEYPGKGHTVWPIVFAEPDLTDWMFSQEKASS